MTVRDEGDVEEGDQHEQIVETENFGVVDDGDHIKVYKKDRDEFGGDELFVKLAEVYRTVYTDE